MHDTTERKDVYSRITDQIVADLEKGVRPWVKPWNAEHAAGRITRPLRHNGQPYPGSTFFRSGCRPRCKNFAAPIWMTFRQALELDAHVRKGEKGSLVVYANSITRTEHDEKSGEDNRQHRDPNGAWKHRLHFFASCADCEDLRNSDLYRPAVGSANGLPQEEMREPALEDF